LPGGAGAATGRGCCPTSTSTTPGTWRTSRSTRFWRGRSTYLTAKDKPLTYIETHAGRGLYRLDAAEARKTGEAALGIGRLEAAFPEDHPYRRRLSEVRGWYGADAYPGSPLIAALSLRDGDRMHLAELHPQEHAALREAMAPFGAHVRKEDGLAMALALARRRRGEASS
jgi:23S rRNA (adenine2030-N6)-methyltransferase